jgi:hypothetical protein
MNRHCERSGNEAILQFDILDQRSPRLAGSARDAPFISFIKEGRSRPLRNKKPGI